MTGKYPYRARPATELCQSQLRHPRGAQLREVHRERIATPGTDFAGFIAAMQGLILRADDALGQRAPVGIGLPGVIDSVNGRQVSSFVDIKPVAAQYRRYKEIKKHLGVSS